jgi:hypothetical protein
MFGNSGVAERLASSRELSSMELVKNTLGPKACRHVCVLQAMFVKCLLCSHTVGCEVRAVCWRQYIFQKEQDPRGTIPVRATEDPLFTSVTKRQVCSAVSE